MSHYDEVDYAEHAAQDAQRDEERAAEMAEKVDLTKTPANVRITTLEDLILDAITAAHEAGYACARYIYTPGPAEPLRTHSRKADEKQRVTTNEMWTAFYALDI